MAITHTRKFKVGKSYMIKDLYDYVSDNEDFDVENYGGNCIGESAIHLQCQDNVTTDIWFILSSATATTYYYRCVYNSQFEL